MTLSKIKKRVISACIAAALSLSMLGNGAFFAVSASAATDASVSALETKLQNIKKQKKDALAKINTAKSNKAKATEYKSYIDEQINLTNDEMDTIEELISELDNQISEKNTSISETEEKIDSEYDNFRQIMRLSYEEGDAGYLEMVLGASDFYDFLVRVDRITALLDYCSGLLSSFRDDKARLETDREQLEEAKESQLTYKADLEERQSELEKLQDENEKYLTSLKNDISAYTSTYNSYAKAEAEIDAELEKLLKELQAKENKDYVGGEFNWPLPLSWKSISSGYGYRTLNGVREFHRGIDIPATKNTPIYASNGGKVVTATFHYSYGNYVMIDHGGGKATLYAHANKLNVKAGDTVKQGDVIAYVGTTGNSYGNHLHFEVRINGAHQNPLNYVAKP